MKREAETYTLVWQFINSVSQTKITTYCHTWRRICLTFCKKRLQTDALSALLAGGGLHRGFHLKWIKKGLATSKNPSE